VTGIAIACHAGAPPASPAAGDRVDRAARACAKIASCAHPHDAPPDRDPGACVDAWLARPAADAVRLETCLDAAAGCGQVDACARERGDLLATAYCRANPGARTACQGTRLVTCSEDDPAESVSTDCAAFGASCGDSKQPGGLLARACLSATLCPSGVPEVRCEGAAAIVSCHEGAVERTACAGPSRCEQHRGADGVLSAICEPPAHRHCDAVGKRWCEQGLLATCQPHGPYGEVATTDCASLGLACADHAQGAACVAAGALPCERAAPRCDGEALAFCAAGRHYRLACRDLGFASCDPDAHGVDAACVQGPPAPAGSHP
jgi:hypothetical protein